MGTCAYIKLSHSCYGNIKGDLKIHVDKCSRDQTKFVSFKENFIDENFLLAKTKQLKSLLAIQEDRYFYLCFIKSFGTSQQLQFFKDLSRLLSYSTKDVANLSEFISGLYFVSNIYALDEAAVRDYLSEDILRRKLGHESNTNFNVFMQLLLESSSECVIISAMSFFPQFSRSNNEFFASSLVTSLNRKMKSIDTELQSECFASDDVGVESFYSSLTSSNLNKYLRGEKWMNSLMLTLENIPFCIVISEVVKREHFPIIYVNKAFEIMTGYQRHEVLGRSCKFLQNSLTEQESLVRLTIALRTAKSERVILTNINKYGEIFKNFLLTKPIFDDAGIYKFVIGILINSSKPSCSAAELIMAENFINMFPNRVFIDS